MRKLPCYGSLIACVHTGAALYAIFYLKMHEALFIFCIAICRTDVGGAVVGTDRVADLCIHSDMEIGRASCRERVWMSDGAECREGEVIVWRSGVSVSIVE